MPCALCAAEGRRARHRHHLHRRPLNSARQFANKMWNAARLLLMNMEARESSRRFPSRRARDSGRPLDLQPPEPHRRIRESRARAASLSRGGRRVVAILLARFLRLVSGDQEAALVAEFRPDQRLAQSAERVRRLSAVAASCHAVHHGRAVAPLRRDTARSRWPPIRREARPTRPPSARWRYCRR